MKILLFGAGGQLGHRLSELLSSRGLVTAISHDQLDLRDLAAVRRLATGQRADLIVNAAAYTAVDAAETDVENARLVNAEAPRVLSEVARETGALLVHYSTDYVFDGSTREPYVEDSTVNPLSVYGRTKLEGEQAIAASGAFALTLRTAWLYSNRGKNFLNTMLRLSEDRTELRVVDDQTGAPTYSDLLAEATLDMLDGMFSHGNVRPERCGLYHVACNGSTSWCGFAKAIMEQSGRSSRVTVRAIPTSEYPTPARRPAYSVLSSEKLARNFGIRLPVWSAGLQRCLAERGPGG